jgi:hypothetical protein
LSFAGLHHGIHRRQLKCILAGAVPALARHPRIRPHQRAPAAGGFGPGGMSARPCAPLRHCSRWPGPFSNSSGPALPCPGKSNRCSPCKPARSARQ